MENTLSPLASSNTPRLHIEAHIENINPLPAGFQWPAGVPEPSIKKAIVTAFAPTAFPAGIQRLALEIEYPDSKGLWQRCQSAPFEQKGTLSSDAAPLIWDAQTADRKYKVSFSWHIDSKAIQLYFKVYFADAALPVQMWKASLTPSTQTPANHHFFIPTPDLSHEQGKI